MIDFFMDHTAEIANLMAILIPIIGFLAWSHKRLRQETKEIREDMKAMNMRIDAVGSRVDHLYEIMIGMLKKSSQ